MAVGPRIEPGDQRVPEGLMPSGFGARCMRSELGVGVTRQIFSCRQRSATTGVLGLGLGAGSGRRRRQVQLGGGEACMGEFAEEGSSIHPVKVY